MIESKRMSGQRHCRHANSRRVSGSTKVIGQVLDMACIHYRQSSRVIHQRQCDSMPHTVEAANRRNVSMEMY